jgi:hypothetical protein
MVFVEYGEQLAGLPALVNKKILTDARIEQSECCLFIPAIVKEDFRHGKTFFITIYLYNVLLPY